MDKLNIFICENIYPEYQEAIQREGINDIELRAYPALCDQNSRKDEAKEVLSQAGMDRSVLICNQSCDALKLIPAGGLVETVTGNYCSAHLTCDSILRYLTSQGGYIVSLGWLEKSKHHLAATGFDQDTAREIFQEKNKRIVFLDAKIDNHAETLLAELSAYLGLPYIVIPIELEIIQLLLKSKLNEWRLYQQDIENTRVINELRRQSSDYAAVFDILGKISSCTSKREILAKVKDLFVMVFGAQSFTFWSDHSDQMPKEIREFKSTDANYLMLKNENRFCMKVAWNGDLYGILDISEFLFPQYIDRYLKLALDIARLLGLVFYNNEQYEKIVKAQIEANAKDRYFAHMNHEIRTPLNGFMGFLQLMDSTGLDQQQQEYMFYMKQSTSHMLKIINNVLDLAKIESGEMKLSKRVFNLEEEIETALAPLRSLAKQKNILLQLKADDGMPGEVEGDPDRLRQIILNLGGNAVKFTQEGQVHITIQCLETTEKHHILKLIVEDTGPGMTQDALNKLFQPFYQTDDGSIPQSKGTGLGMVITQELVELMGGEICVDSTLGKGTSVELTVELNKVTDMPDYNVESRLSSEMNGSSNQDQRRVLVVEDEELNQLMIRRILERKGFCCDVVYNGQQALERVVETSYDLILMDIQLPVMDGLEATRQIRSLSDIRQPLIIAVTACCSLEMQESFKKAGMDEFLAKPITFADLERLLDEKT